MGRTEICPRKSHTPQTQCLLQLWSPKSEDETRVSLGEAPTNERPIMGEDAHSLSCYNTGDPQIAHVSAWLVSEALSGPLFWAIFSRMFRQRTTLKGKDGNFSKQKTGMLTGSLSSGFLSCSDNHCTHRYHLVLFMLSYENWAQRAGAKC